MKNKAKKAKQKARKPLEWFHAKDNPLFPPEMTALIRFARYGVAVPCVHCGRKSRRHWTMVIPFGACTFPGEMGTPEGFVLPPPTKVLPAGSPVCRSHPMAPRLEALMEEEIVRRNVRLSMFYKAAKADIPVPKCKPPGSPFKQGPYTSSVED